MHRRRVSDMNHLSIVADATADCRGALVPAKGPAEHGRDYPFHLSRFDLDE
jgi:hypothetical protein